MNLTVHGKNVAISDRVQEYVEKKVSRLGKYLPQIREARAELVRSETRAASDRFTAQLTIWTNRQILRAEESSEDLFASIDAIADKMYRQIERFKGRRFQSRRRDAAAAAAAIDLSATHKELVEIEKQIWESMTKHNAFLKELGLSPLPARSISDQSNPRLCLGPSTQLQFPSKT